MTSTFPAARCTLAIVPGNFPLSPQFRFAAFRAAIDQSFGAMFAVDAYSMCGTTPLYVFLKPRYAAGEIKMNWDQAKGNWKQFKGQVKQKWGKLTDDELDVIDGKREELAGKLQAHYGYAKERAEREVDEFCSSCKC